MHLPPDTDPASPALRPKPPPLFLSRSFDAPPYRVNWLRSSNGKLLFDEHKIPPKGLEALKWPFYSPSWGAVVSSLTDYPAPWIAQGIERSHLYEEPLPNALQSLPDPSPLPFGPPFDDARFIDPWHWSGAVRTFDIHDDQLAWSDEGQHFDDWDGIESGWVAEWGDEGWVLLDPSTLEPLDEIPDVLRLTYEQGRAWVQRLNEILEEPDDSTAATDT